MPTLLSHSDDLLYRVFCQKSNSKVTFPLFKARPYPPDPPIHVQPKLMGTVRPPRFLLIKPLRFERLGRESMNILSS